MQKLAQTFILSAVFFAVWSTSGTRPLSGSAMLGISALAFVFSILSWGFNKNSKFSTLAKNPFLIGGGILVLLGIIQVLNPHTIAYDADGYLHARSIEYIKWLPSGIKADAEVYGSAKAVAELLTAYFFASALFFYSKNAKFCKFLIKFFALNIAAMSIFAIAQKILNAQAVYFLFSTDSQFYGPYYYANATCAAIFLGLCATAASFCLDFETSNSFKKKALSFLWIFPAIPQTAAIFISTSVGGKMSALIFSALLILFAIFVFLKKKIGVSKTLAAIFAIIIISAFPAFNAAKNSYENLSPTKKASVIGRAELAFLAKDVFLKAPIFGSGADSFGYSASKVEAKKTFGNKFANSAHNSILNYACEYGIAGIAAIFALFFLWAKRLFARRKILQTANIICLMGLTVSTFHSMFDIFLQIPSTMVFYALIMTLSASILKGAKDEA